MYHTTPFPVAPTWHLESFLHKRNGTSLHIVFVVAPQIYHFCLYPLLLFSLKLFWPFTNTTYERPLRMILSFWSRLSSVQQSQNHHFKNRQLFLTLLHVNSYNSSLLLLGLRANCLPCFWRSFLSWPKPTFRLLSSCPHLPFPTHLITNHNNHDLWPAVLQWYSVLWSIRQLYCSLTPSILIVSLF